MIKLSPFRKEERIEQLSHGKPSLENEISTLERRMNQIREELSGSATKQEALSLIDQIYELEITYDHLTDLSISSPDDEQIDKFLESFDQTREQYLNDIQQIQKTNLTLVEMITRSLIKNPYEIEKEKSSNTIIILTDQHRKLKQDYVKLEVLDRRLNNELEELKLKYKKMKEDLEIFNDLESLKRKAERRKQQLITDKINMIKQRQITQMEIQSLQSQFDAMQKQLHEHETHQQVRSSRNYTFIHPFLYS